MVHRARTGRFPVGCQRTQSNPLPKTSDVLPTRSCGWIVSESGLRQTVRERNDGSRLLMSLRYPCLALWHWLVSA